MKRIIAIILLTALLLAGCGAQDASEKEITISFDFGERKGTYIGEYDSKGVPHGYGVFSSQRSDGTKWTYSGQWEHGHWNGYGSTVWEDGQTYSGEYSNDYVSGYGAYNLSNGEYAIGECDDSGLNGMGMHVTTTGETVTGKFVNGVPTGWCTMYLTGAYDGYVFWGFFENGDSSGVCYTPDGNVLKAEFHNSQLSVSGTVAEEKPEPTEAATIAVPENNGLSDEQFAICIGYLNNCQYAELSEFLIQLLENGEITESERLTKILSDCSALVELASKCDIKIDSIEKETTVYYKGLTEISRTVCVVPYVSATNEYVSSADYKLGFIKNGWLFFDEVIISSDNAEPKSMTCNYYEPIHDVLSGGTISEYVYSGFLNIAPFAADSNPVIRFKNSDTKETYDHQLTDLEIKAVTTVSEFSKLHASVRSRLERMAEK